jgi:hypothetical protein
MAVQGSYTQFLDNLYTTTWQNRQDGTADNIFNATPFWFWMKENGRMTPQRGGRFIEENLEYAANANTAWVQKGSTVSLNDFEFLTVAQYQWRYLAASIVRFGIDDQQNAGKAKIMSLMQSKMDNTEQSLIEIFESQLTGSVGTVNGIEIAIDGLQCLVADNPTINFGGNGIAVGGIDSSATSPTSSTWWQNQYYNMNGVSFGTSGVAQMRHMLNNCMQNRIGDRPDIILCDQTTYEYYENATLQYLRITNNKLGDAGFENQTFKQIPMVWSPTVTSRMYFLNSRFLKFIYDPAQYFSMTEWKPIPDQINDRAAQIITACQLTTDRRRVHGVLSNINTA